MKTGAGGWSTAHIAGKKAAQIVCPNVSENNESQDHSIPFKASFYGMAD
jgi:hypothetical protein